MPGNQTEAEKERGQQCASISRGLAGRQWTQVNPMSHVLRYDMHCGVTTTSISACTGRETTGAQMFSSPLMATAHSVSASEAHRLIQRHDLLIKSAIFQQFWKVLAGLAAESQALRTSYGSAPRACAASPSHLDLSPAQPPSSDGFPPLAWRPHVQTGIPQRTGV